MLVFLGVLACMSVGVLSAEPPVSPWQALNPSLGEPTRAEIDAAQEEFDDTPYDVTYPEGHNETERQYHQEEDDMMAELPFKLPFKMDKKQSAVAMKLLKEAVKPVLKSKRLQEFVAYLDDSIASYRSDLESQMYVTLVLDSLQEIYEGKETSELNIILKRFFENMSDEETARTLDSVWRSYVTPVLTSYIYNPMRNYVVTPVRSYIYEPITNYVSEFAERIGTWMESSRRPYIDIQYPEYSRWSQTFNDYANRISDWTAQARDGLAVARRMLELQDEARGCYDCGVQQQMDSQEIYSVQQ